MEAWFCGVWKLNAWPGAFNCDIMADRVQSMLSSLDSTASGTLQPQVLVRVVPARALSTR